MKKLIRILAVVLCLVVVTGSFAGCKNNEPENVIYEEMDLATAYESGWLTQEHLKSIAYYYNEETETPNFQLIPKVELSKGVENNIKLSYLQRQRIKSSYPNATVNDISVFRYYGTYDGYAVVFILDSLFSYDLWFEPEQKIGGVIFYNYCSLYVYDINAL